MPPPDTETKDRVKVYYNSACPVCAWGIKAQQDKMQGCPVSWNDVHSNSSCRDDLESDLEFVRERLHVVDEQDRTWIGLDAFIALWRVSPGEQWKARIFSLPVVHLFSTWSYNAFAFCLYRWNKALKHW